MTATQKSECPAATGQNAYQPKHAVSVAPADFKSYLAKRQKAHLLARMARAGHQVTAYDDGSFIARKYGLTRYCADFADLQRFAQRLGVCDDL